ncbi:MAG: ribosome recycling factor [Clostridia bacterium]|nr:ribosome recycling factor [Clostridia bacterium]
MQTVFNYVEEKMGKTVANLLSEYTGIRAGRASAGVLDHLSVEYYGVPTPINQLANVSTPEPRLLIVQPYDKTLLKEIAKAIMVSDLGINPQNDGTVIRLVFPPLTEERRKEIGKNIYKYAEEAKVAIRSIRRDGIDKIKTMKKNSEITEDDQKNAEKKLQDLTDKYCKEIDGHAVRKEKEIMEF